MKEFNLSLRLMRKVPAGCLTYILSRTSPAKETLVKINDAKLSKQAKDTLRHGLSHNLRTNKSFNPKKIKQDLSESLNRMKGNLCDSLKDRNILHSGDHLKGFLDERKTLQISVKSLAQKILQ